MTTTENPPAASGPALIPGDFDVATALDVIRSYLLLTQASSSTQAWQFKVSAYEAKGDGVTDDTLAIKNAVAAAVAYATANGSYAEVLFDDKTYLVNGAPVQGGTGLTNAQIPLPWVAGTAQKITLVFKGPGDASLPYGAQTSGKQSGAVIKSTYVGSNDATYGETSVIGGPTPKQGGGWNGGTSAFTNICFILDGVQLLIPNDPHISGLDLRGVAEVVIRSGGVFVNQGIATISAPTQSWQFSLAMPERGNNALAHFDRFGTYGSYLGIITGEHTTGEWLATILCWVGIGVHASGPHHAKIKYACVELVAIAVGALDSYGYIDIDMLDYEKSTGSFNPNFGIESVIEDSNYLTNFGNRTSYNKLQGRIRVNNNGDPLYNIKDRIFGGGLMQIECANTAPGNPANTYPLAQPALPATGVAYVNQFFRNATVTITGGSITAIAIDGVTTGMTSGTFTVPSNRAITITYTGTPSWSWILH